MVVIIEADMVVSGWQLYETGELVVIDENIYENETQFLADRPFHETAAILAASRAALVTISRNRPGGERNW